MGSVVAVDNAIEPLVYVCALECRQVAMVMVGLALVQTVAMKIHIHRTRHRNRRLWRIAVVLMCACVNSLFIYFVRSSYYENIAQKLIQLIEGNCVYTTESIFF